MGKGSCRSYGGVNLFQALSDCAPLLEGFGGHALAAGFTVREENIPALAQSLRRAVAGQLEGTVPLSVLRGGRRRDLRPADRGERPGSGPSGALRHGQPPAGPGA